MGSIRIIGGKWRRQRLKVTATHWQLRPTADRVRELLFNWLRDDLPGLTCLDLFSGTGALGFEAASHGAKKVILVERDPQIAMRLRRQITVFSADEQINVDCVEAITWLKRAKQRFHFVFLDPPFGSSLIETSCALLLKNKLLHTSAKVYLESKRDITVPNGYQILKERMVGQVQCRLVTRLI